MFCHEFPLNASPIRLFIKRENHCKLVRVNSHSQYCNITNQFFQLYTRTKKACLKSASRSTNWSHKTKIERKMKTFIGLNYNTYEAKNGLVLIDLPILRWSGSGSISSKSRLAAIFQEIKLRELAVYKQTNREIAREGESWRWSELWPFILEIVWKRSFLESMRNHLRRRYTRWP